MATGCLSMPKDLDIDGVENFTGEVYFTSRWPHEPVDFTGKRVGVVGTGSSGIQSIPLIAAQAAQLVVFQRTPCFSIPAHNGPIAPDKLAQLVDDAAYRQAARYSFGGVPLERTITPAFSVSADERQQRYERAWQRGELLEMLNLYADMMSNPVANNDFAEFIRGKIRGIVRRSADRRRAMPQHLSVGAKRLCLDTDYYATFNLPHVRLVNLQRPAAVRRYRDRNRHGRRIFRVRRDCVRHRLRRDHGRRRGDRHRRPRRARAEGQMAARSVHLPRADHRGISQPVSHRRVPAAPRCCRTWRCPSSSTSTSSPTL